VLSSACALAIALALATHSGQATTPADRPFHDLPANFGRDVRALPSAETALVIGATVAGALALRPVDDNLADWARQAGTSRYTQVGDVLGDGWVQAGAAIGVYAAGLARRDRTTTHLGSDLIRAQLLNGVITRGLKLAVDRDRPSGGGHSFPSGHSSAAFASAAVVGSHFGWKAGLPAYAAAAFIGWTRVRDDAHWLSDVIIGGAVGTVVGRAVARGHGSPRWTIAPSATTTSVGVTVVRNPN
jgi:membrane-associated phospholipid phosphatase